MNDLNNINTEIASLNPNDLLRVILYGDESFNKEANCKILTASLKFIKDIKRFENLSFSLHISSLIYYSKFSTDK